MAEYYDESRNEGPNILGMAGLLGLGALAGAGGYYALRNTRGKNAAAEALTRSARSERPRGVQMTDLGARRTGDFGLVDIPPSRSTRITGDRGVIQSPIANDIVTDLPEVVASAPRERMVRRHGRMVPLSSLQSQVAPHAPEQYSNVPPSVPPTTPTSEQRSQVYANVAAKPESELPSVYKPQGGTTEEMLITDPNTGEMYRRGGGGSYFASKAAELAGNVLTDLPEAVASAPRERMVRRHGRMVPLSSLQQKQPAIPTATVDLNLQNQATDAVESGAAQQTGRTWQQLSRNEDLDKTQIAQLEAQADADFKAMLGSNPSEWSGVEGDVAINTVAQVLPDGLPVDQAEGIGYDLRTGERFKFGGARPARPARTGLAPGGTIELQAAPGADLGQSSAARFLQQRREKLMEDAGTSGRLETQLAEAFGPEAWREDPKATRRRNALKLGAAGNEQFFENLNEGTVTIAGEQFPVSSLKEGVYMEDTAQNLANKVNRYKDFLGNIRLEEIRNQIGLANELENLIAQDEILKADLASVSPLRKSFTSTQERDDYIAARRANDAILDLQDDLDVRINENLGRFQTSENRIAKTEAATARKIQRAAVPQKLMGGVEEGIVVRPILTAPDNMVVEEGELSNIERGRPVGQFISQEQLEVVPGGLLSGGRAKSVPNIGSDLGIDPETGDRITSPNVNQDTGETLVQKLAGKRMGGDVNVRGRGGVAGMETKASIGIYGPELAEYGTAAMTKQGEYTGQASRPPSATDSSVGVYKVRKYVVDDKNPEGKAVFFSSPSSYVEPEAYKYSQAITPQGLQSIDLSRAVQGIYASDPRELAEAKVKVGLSGMAQLAGKQLPPSATSSRFGATGPSTPLERTIQERTPEGQFKTYQVSNRPVAPTEEQIVNPLEPIQLSFRSDVVPPIARTRVSEADAYANQLANYMAKMQRGQTEAISSPVVIQPNLVVTEEYQLPLALSAGAPTPQIQGPMRATPQLRGFEAPIQYVETYQPTLFAAPTETLALQNPVANLTLRERNAENRLQRIREDIANSQQRRLAGGI
jgi:hypothetical protein